MTTKETFCVGQANGNICFKQKGLARIDFGRTPEQILKAMDFSSQNQFECVSSSENGHRRIRVFSDRAVLSSGGVERVIYRDQVLSLSQDSATVRQGEADNHLIAHVLAQKPSFGGWAEFNDGFSEGDLESLEDEIFAQDARLVDMQIHSNLSMQLSCIALLNCEGTFRFEGDEFVFDLREANIDFPQRRYKFNPSTFFRAVYQTIQNRGYYVESERGLQFSRVKKEIKIMPFNQSGFRVRAEDFFLLLLLEMKERGYPLPT